LAFVVLVVFVVVVRKGRGGGRPGLDVDVAIAYFWGREEGVGGWGFEGSEFIKVLYYILGRAW